MSDFLAQGGYGAFIWGAYGMVAAALVAEVLQLSLRSRAVRRRIARLSRLAQAGGKAVGSEPGTSVPQTGQTEADRMTQGR